MKRNHPHVAAGLLVVGLELSGGPMIPAGYTTEPAPTVQVTSPFDSVKDRQAEHRTAS
jgi:hypothetical protein